MGRGVPGAAPTVAFAHARLTALRTLAVPILQSAIAAGLAWYLAHDVIGHSRAFFAPIAALIALGVGVANRPRRVVELTFGVAVGIGVGDVLIWGIGSGTWQLGLIVALAMVAAVLIGGGPLFVAQAASSAVLVATLVGAHNASRFVDALVGGAVGLAVLVVVPVNPLREARRSSEIVFSELAASLDDIAAGAGGAGRRRGPSRGSPAHGPPRVRSCAGVRRSPPAARRRCSPRCTGTTAAGWRGTRRPPTSSSWPSATRVSSAGRP